MTEPSGETPPPPGWYREHAGAPEMRWWDGRAWTDHRSAAGVSGTIVQPPLPAGRSTNTVWIWLLSLLPLVSLAAVQPVLLAFGPLIQDQVRMQRELLENPQAVPTLPAGLDQFGGLLALSWGSSFVLIGLAALAARLDWSALKRRGIVRPFPWGWGFLAGVYIVGRSVVVHRRVGEGYGPLVLAIVLFVAAMVTQFAEFLALFAAASAAIR